MRLVIETLDTVREVNRWEIADLAEAIPNWASLGEQQRLDRVTMLIGEEAEFCRNLEAETIERDLLEFRAEGSGGEAR